MRFFDAMSPAKSMEEGALAKAAVPTLAGGAALKSVCRRERLPAAVEINEKPAGSEKTGTDRSCALRRAAFRQIVGKHF